MISCGSSVISVDPGGGRAGAALDGGDERVVDAARADAEGLGVAQPAP